MLFRSVCSVSDSNDACPDVPCSTLYKGWVGNTCERYSDNSPGYCGSTAVCVTSAAQVCPTLTSIATIVTTCDSSCVDESACQAFAPINGTVCLTDRPSSNCDTLPCKSLVFGWTGTRCMRYADSVEAPGHCTSSSVCASNAASRCQHLTAPATALVQGNCDAGCQRPNS